MQTPYYCLPIPKVTAAAPKLKVADVLYNVEQIKKLVQECPSDFILTPELSLTGYTCQDLFLQSALQSKVDYALAYLVANAPLNPGQTLIVGAPIAQAGRLYNCAVVIMNENQGNRIAGIVPKTYLPNYGEFYEQRWFASAREVLQPTVRIGRHEVPFGSDLIFQEYKSKLTWGIEICEDLWAINPPSNNLALSGAHLIFNLSASNELVGKANYRKELVKSQSGRLMCAYIYASSGAGESGSDTIFSGHTIIAENDHILAEGKRFSFETESVTAQISMLDIEGERQRNATFSEQRPQPMRTVTYGPKDGSGMKTAYHLGNTSFDRKINPTPFLPAPQDEDDTFAEIVNIQTTALKRRLLQIGKPNVVIGVSGGLDSTLALLIASRACKELEMDPTQIIGITMPGMGTSERTKCNALDLMAELGITQFTTPISDAAEAQLRSMGHDGVTPDITYENVQARERSVHLFNRANHHKGLVLGTGDMSELALGWMTYFGDSESHYHVNMGLPKTLVKPLVMWLAQQPDFETIRVFIEDICDTPISPELTPPDAQGRIQSTEESVGPYLLQDFFLYWGIRKQLPPLHVLLYATSAFESRYGIEELAEQLMQFYKRFFANQFKRNSSPDGVKIGTLSLSQRADWRMPSDAAATLWIQELGEFVEMDYQDTPI